MDRSESRQAFGRIFSRLPKHFLSFVAVSGQAPCRGLFEVGCFVALLEDQYNHSQKNAQPTLTPVALPTSLVCSDSEFSVFFPGLCTANPGNNGWPVARDPDVDAISPALRWLFAYF